MSSILDALKKLEAEKAAKQIGEPEPPEEFHLEAAEEELTAAGRGRASEVHVKPAWLLAGAGIFAIVLVVVSVTVSIVVTRASVHSTLPPVAANVPLPPQNPPPQPAAVPAPPPVRSVEPPPAAEPPAPQANETPPAAPQIVVKTLEPPPPPAKVVEAPAAAIAPPKAPEPAPEPKAPAPVAPAKVAAPPPPPVEPVVEPPKPAPVVVAKNIPSPEPSPEPAVVPPAPPRAVSAPPPAPVVDTPQPVLPKASTQKTAERINLDELPILKSSDRARFGLENLKLNVLREANGNRPNGLAIINLNKVYIGEVIPGTRAKLIDVKSHGIGIEIINTGEKFYVAH